MAEFVIRPGREFQFNAVDRALLSILQAAAARAPGGISKVEATSGKAGRATGTGNHLAGRAIDVQLYDKGGKPILNYVGNPFGVKAKNNAAAYNAYEKFAQVARQVQQDQFPGLSKAFRWGGYFVSGVNPGDLMHFDLSGGRSPKTPPQAERWLNGIGNGITLGAKALEGTPPVQAAAAPDNRPTMYGLQGLLKVYGNKTPQEIDAAMAKIAASKGYRYEPIAAAGGLGAGGRKPQIDALVGKVKPGDAVIGFSAGGYAARDALKLLPPGALKEAVIIGAPGVEKQFPGVQATFVPEMPGVAHMDLVQTVAAKVPQPVNTPPVQVAAAPEADVPLPRPRPTTQVASLAPQDTLTEKDRDANAYDLGVMGTRAPRTPHVDTGGELAGRVSDGLAGRGGEVEVLSPARGGHLERVGPGVRVGGDHGAPVGPPVGPVVVGVHVDDHHAGGAGADADVGGGGGGPPGADLFGVEGGVVEPATRGGDLPTTGAREHGPPGADVGEGGVEH